MSTFCALPNDLLLHVLEKGETDRRAVSMATGLALVRKDWADYVHTLRAVRFGVGADVAERAGSSGRPGHCRAHERLGHAAQLSRRRRWKSRRL